MAFLPFEHISYHSKLSGEDIRIRLFNAIDPGDFSKGPALLREWSKRYPSSYSGNLGLFKFNGAIDGNSFVMVRKTGYNNPFHPVITGEVINDSNRVIVNVKMRVRLPALISTGLFIAVVLFTGLIIVLGMILNWNFEIINLIPICVAVLAYILMTGFYKFESSKSIQLLKKLFSAEIAE